MIRSIIKEILRGKTLVRTLMNLELENYTLSGRVLDIGGGDNPSYLRFLKKSPDLEFKAIDLKSVDVSRRLDLEKDSLPFGDNSLDQVLLFNILEHIYNHRFLIGEARRVLKVGGSAFGFVPFLVGYHPDPHDYFRYTEESLSRLLAEAGLRDVVIKEVGWGPLSACYNLVMARLPGFINVLFLPVVYSFDKLLAKGAKRFPLGYLFTAQK